eukprot:12293426-Alexandrium_andersonii.AAC.1
MAQTPPSHPWLRREGTTRPGYLRHERSTPLSTTCDPTYANTRTLPRSPHLRTQPGTQHHRENQPGGKAQRRPSAKTPVRRANTETPAAA